MSRVFIFLLMVLGCSALGAGANKYVDLTATGTRDGLSWANAWTNMSSVTTLTVTNDDIVNISGGTAGSHKVYPLQFWVPPNGTPGHRITYQIGQEAGHNGTAWFDGRADTGSGASPTYWLFAATHDITITGDAGDGVPHFGLTNYTVLVVCSAVTNTRLAYLTTPTIGSITILTQACSLLQATNLEVDHTIFRTDYCVNTNAFEQGYSFFDVNCLGPVGANSFHHNVAIIPYRYGTNLTSPQCTAGVRAGNDMFTFTGAGIDIYSNHFDFFYQSGQGMSCGHQDGIVGGAWQRMRCWANTFVGCANYTIYMVMNGSGSATNYSDSFYADNLFVDCGGAFSIAGCDNAAFPSYFSNIVTLNNVIDNATNSSAQSFAAGGGTCATNVWVTNCINANNIIIGGGDYSFLYFASNMARMTNLYLTTTEASNYFTSYLGSSTATTNSNLRPLSSATRIVGAGTNMSAYYAYDFIGNAWVPPWSLGLYQLQTTNVPTPPAQINVHGTMRVGTIIISP